MDQNDARFILQQLSGNTHQVFTAICVYFNQQRHYLIQKNSVTFKKLNTKEINDYIASNEPMGKAGAYAIQGDGSLFISHLNGSFTGVMGLPIFETIQLLNQC